MNGPYLVWAWDTNGNRIMLVQAGGRRVNELKHTTTKQFAAPAKTDGGCFVVVSESGECWSGESWVPLWAGAMQFRRPGPAYEQCAEAARAAEERTGVAGMVNYLPTGFPLAPLAPYRNHFCKDLRPPL